MGSCPARVSPNKSPARGTGLSWSCVPYKGLPISSGGQQAHHLNTEPQSWFHTAREAAQTKAPPERG